MVTSADSVLGRGVYSLPEAGRYAGVSAGAARAWFNGWHKSKSGPLLCSEYAGLTDRPVISFLDFTDLLVVGKLREIKAKWPSIRRAHAALKVILSSEHPFSHAEFYADDKGNLFRLAADKTGDKTLVEILRKQHAFPELLLPFLKRLDYDPETQLARTYTIADGVVLDAGRKYGKPITKESAMPTMILARAFEAHDHDAESVADWYGVSSSEVLRAVRFEEEMNSAA